MRARMMLGALALALTAGTVTPLSTPPAEAAGRKIVARKMVATWGRTVKVWYPNPELILPRSFQLRATINTVYWWWPQDTALGHNRVGPVSTEVCYSFIDDHRPSVLFDGIKALPTYYDSNLVVKPGWVKAGKDGRQNCVDKVIAKRKRKWLRLVLGSQPMIQATGNVVWKHWPDQEFQWMTDSGRRVRPIDPLNDFPLTGWRSINKPF